MRQRFSDIDAALDANALIAERILKHTLGNFGFDVEDGITGNEPWQRTCTPEDLVKASTIVNQFYRDWSTEGNAERKAHFEPILKDLETLYNGRSDRSNIKILIPGAGLGRLVFDLCDAGFDVEGNEVSFHALFASNWILNALGPLEKYNLHPFVLKFSNQERLQDQLMKVEIPDVHPGTELEKDERERQWPAGRMSMSASDFLTAYQQEHQREEFDAVATVFFIDTAPNVIRYIETIRHTLKIGGYWINLGPLLWHWEDRKPGDAPQMNPDPQKIPGIEEPGSIALTHEDVIALVQKMGFEIESLETRSENSVGYIEQRSSMLQNTYRVSHFVAKKLAME